MTADGGTDVVLNNRDGIVLLGKQFTNPVSIFFGISMTDKGKIAVFSMSLLIERS